MSCTPLSPLLCSPHPSTTPLIMTSFQSLTRGASAQHAMLGNSGGSKDRAPSCDSGFASDPDRTGDVGDNKSSFLRNEILTLEKFLGQQIEINVSQQNNIDQLTQQNEQLTQQNQGLQDELRIIRSEIRSLNRKFEKIESALAAKKTKKLVFPRYSQSSSFSQYILVLRNYILVMQKHWDGRGYDDERTAEELFAALVHEDFFPSFLHQWDKREKTKSKICVEDVISALEQSDIRHAFSTPMEGFSAFKGWKVKSCIHFINGLKYSVMIFHSTDRTRSVSFWTSRRNS